MGDAAQEGADAADAATADDDLVGLVGLCGPGDRGRGGSFGDFALELDAAEALAVTLEGVQRAFGVPGCVPDHLGVVQGTAVVDRHLVRVHEDEAAVRITRSIALHRGACRRDPS